GLFSGNGVGGLGRRSYLGDKLQPLLTRLLQGREGRLADTCQIQLPWSQIWTKFDSEAGRTFTILAKDCHRRSTQLDLHQDDDEASHQAGI
ncbi:unnamed protein product, partial [Sphagnum tenellum]